MIDWPSLHAPREARAVEPVEPEQANEGTSAPAVDEPIESAVPVSARRRFGLRLAIALALSGAAHAAAFGWLFHIPPRPGLEAANDAVAVRIVVAAREAASSAAEAERVEANVTERPVLEPVATAEPIRTSAAEPERVEAAEPDRLAPSDSAPIVRPARTQPADTPEPDRAEPEAVMAEPARAPSPPRISASGPEPVLSAARTERSFPASIAPEPVAPAATMSLDAVDEAPEIVTGAAVAALSAALPEAMEVLPSPRPEPPPAPRRQVAEPTRAPPASAERQPTSAATASTSSAASPARASASAGEKREYAQRLLRHVERRKRYPAAAQRARITGAAQLTITIDRSGGLTGARLTASSGHEVLDQEALAVASRAAPYPPPPDGIGGSTFSFAVTLRFSR